MPHWMIKAALQGGMAQLPQPERYNRLFQRYVTRRLAMSEQRVRGKFSQCRRHIENWAEFGGEEAPVAMELGTGWYPVVPIGLILLGAERVVTVDIKGHMSDEAPRQAAECYLKLIDAGELGEVDGERLERLREATRSARSGPALLDRLGIRSVVADAAALPLEAETIDMFVSNNTLEHVPGESIAAIFREYGRVARPQALMSHFIDMADHYALFDRTITVYNYMRFSEAQWRLFNNSLHYQNRLRLSDYRRLHEDAGWEILHEEPTEGSAQDLSSVPLDASFRRYSEQDLRVFASWVVSRTRASRAS